MNYALVVRELKKHYSHDQFAKQHDRNPYKVLVACILSLRTKDETTWSHSDTTSQA